METELQSVAVVVDGLEVVWKSRCSVAKKSCHVVLRGWLALDQPKDQGSRVIRKTLISIA